MVKQQAQGTLKVRRLLKQAEYFKQLAGKKDGRSHSPFGRMTA
ncbi:hypothetical protein MKY25_13480 [Geobacillus sp. FSL W8-0032]|nr:MULTISPECIES: hypothetical protein [Geobacillus]KYD26461.1 hypothetical protein B4113_1042 [Geobacillus sp. B4113_201601]